ncbi:MAG TPA: 3-hydroxyacyl-CoA dehydrogenase family protein [Candidatus Angelobacter sp.]|nr:3-hydroxyacyl-CoA dehydrogenase family protein [Candidatus Angelobacter sp.]
MAEISTVAVIGGGAMAQMIALAAIRGGYRTILQNILPTSLRNAENEIRKSLDQAVQGGELSSNDADSAFRLLEYAGTVEEAARQADLVIEAVPDEMDSKLEIITLLDKVSRPHTILACTTSSLSVTEIASVTYRPENILGMRFADKRLELVRGRETNDATVAACIEVGRQMGKEVVVIAEDRHATDA